MAFQPFWVGDVRIHVTLQQKPTRLRALRLVRIARVLRLFKYFKALWLVLKGLANAMRLVHLFFRLTEQLEKHLLCSRADRAGPAPTVGGSSPRSSWSLQLERGLEGRAGGGGRGGARRRRRAARRRVTSGA